MSSYPPNQTSGRLGARYSADARRQRAMLHHYVLRGGSLTLLLRDAEHALEAVEICKLARWMPGVGNTKAARILAGLPERYTLSMLSAEQRTVFTNRVAQFERRIIARRIARAHPYQEKTHA